MYSSPCVFYLLLYYTYVGRSCCWWSWYRCWLVLTCHIGVSIISSPWSQHRHKHAPEQKQYPVLRNKILRNARTGILPTHNKRTATWGTVLWIICIKKSITLGLATQTHTTLTCQDICTFFGVLLLNRAVTGSDGTAGILRGHHA